jgi:hypothetical protein
MPVPPGITGMAKPSKSERDYRAEDDCHTLLRANEITSDPDRHTNAKKHAGKQLRTFRKIAGLPKFGSSRGRR